MMRGVNMFIGLALVVSLLTAIVMWNEFFLVRSLQGNGDYPFGSEEAIAIGGKAYASKELYLRSVLLDGLMNSFATLLILGGLFSRYKWLAIVGTALWLLCRLLHLAHLL